MSSNGKQKYTVLIVDDSKEDRFFIRAAVQRFPRFVVIGELGDGEEAVAYLGGKGAFAEREKHPLPDLMLLDLKMPKKSGFDVLHWLRKCAFPELTVIILSCSAMGEDIGAGLALGAHGYWTKALDFEKQNLVTQEIEELLDKRWSALLMAS